MELKSKALVDGKSLSGKYSFCALTSEKEVIMGENINPDLAWSGIPEGSKSFVLICHDSEVPTSAENVNKKGKIVPKELHRTDFYHWVLYNIPADSKGISEGEFSKGITPHGKKDINTSQGAKQGLNNYTDWFKGDNDMKGDYYGYDGPCPPWNDERIHIYHFTLYALDLEELTFSNDRVGGPEVLEAMGDHILEKAKITVNYTLNKDLV